MSGLGKDQDAHVAAYRAHVTAAVKARKRSVKEQTRAKRRAVLASAVDPVDWRAANHGPGIGKAPGVIKNAESRKDDKGRLSHPHKVHDTLAAIRISKAQEDAGRHFEELFEMVARGTLRPASLVRSGGAPRDCTPCDAALQAQGAVNRAMRALGGPRTHSATVVGLVLGDGLTLRQTADRLAYLPSGKKGETAAKWLLVAALDVLAAHFGYSLAKNKS